MGGVIRAHETANNRRTLAGQQARGHLIGRYNVRGNVVGRIVVKTERVGEQLRTLFDFEPAAE